MSALRSMFTFQPYRIPRALYLAAFLAGVADTLLVFYLPLYLHRNLHENHLIVVGLVVALPQLGVVLASNFWGALGDQWRKLRPLVLIGVAGYTAMLFTLSAAHSSNVVLVTALLGSLIYAAFKPGAYTFVTLREPEHKGHALASLLRAQSIGWFAGNLFCGQIWKHFGAGAMPWVLIGAGSLGVLVLAGMWRWMPEIEPEAYDQPREAAPRREGVWRELLALYENPKLVWLSVLWMFVTSGRWLFFTFLAVFFTDHLHGTIDTISLASAASAMAGILFFGLAGVLVDRYGARQVLAGAVLAYFIYFGMNVAISSPVLLAVLFVIPIYPAFSVAGNALVASWVPSEQRSGALGMITGIEAAGALSGALLGGWASDHYGVGIVPAASTILAGVAVLVGVTALGARKFRRREA